MAQQSPERNDEGATGNVVFAALSAAPRRIALQHLARESTSASVEDLVDALADDYGMGNLRDAGAEERRQWRIALVHTHLPKLQSAGLVSWDGAVDEVVLTTWGRQLSLHDSRSDDATSVTFPRHRP